MCGIDPRSVRVRITSNYEYVRPVWSLWEVWVTYHTTVVTLLTCPGVGCGECASSEAAVWGDPRDDLTYY